MNTQTAKELKRRLHAKNNRDKKPHHDFPTPANLADDIAKSLDIYRNMAILEPSCGEGSLINAVLRRVDTLNKEFAEISIDPIAIEIDAVEIDGINIALAADIQHDSATITVNQANFLEWQAPRQYDRIIMNPPFNGQEYIKHVAHALSMLKDGGRMIAIVPTMALHNDNFRALIGDHYHEIYETMPGEFAESGASKTMKAFVVQIDKDKGNRAPHQGWDSRNAWEFNLCITSAHSLQLTDFANGPNSTREYFAKSVRRIADNLIQGNVEQGPMLRAFWMTDAECNELYDHYHENDDDQPAPIAVVTPKGETQYAITQAINVSPAGQLALFA